MLRNASAYVSTYVPTHVHAYAQYVSLCLIEFPLAVGSCINIGAQSFREPVVTEPAQSLHDTAIHFMNKLGNVDFNRLKALAGCLDGKDHDACKWTFGPTYVRPYVRTCIRRRAVEQVSVAVRVVARCVHRATAICGAGGFLGLHMQWLRRGRFGHEQFHVRLQRAVWSRGDLQTEVLLRVGEGQVGV